MRILIVTNMFPCDDLEHYGVFVREHIASLEAHGFTFDVFFTNARDSRRRYITDIPRLVRTLRGKDYSVLHAEHTYSLYQVVFARRIARVSTPVMFTIHEGEASLPEEATRPEGDILKRLVYVKSLKRWALKMSDRVVTVDRALIQALGFSGSFEVIPPGVDCESFRPLDRAECRKQLNLPADKPILFFPASPSRPEKGWELFEDAVRRLSVPVRVISGGSFDRSEMPLYMNAADVVVQTSRFEASPMVVKEAMACNTPVVSTDVGDVSELFGDTHGYYCIKSEPIAVVAALESALALDERPRGRDRIYEKGVSLDAIAKRYARLYEEAALSTSS